MPRTREQAPAPDSPSWPAFEAHLWKAVERGSVTAMKLWADLHRGELEDSEDAELLEFVPRADRARR